MIKVPTIAQLNILMKNHLIFVDNVFIILIKTLCSFSAIPNEWLLAILCYCLATIGAVFLGAQLRLCVIFSAPDGARF